MSAGSRTLKIQILGDAKSAQQAFGQIDGAAGQTEGKLGRLAKVAGAAFLGIGVAAGAFAVQGVKSFIDFDDRMTKSVAIMGDVSDEMRSKMEGAARDVAKTTTFSAGEAADAYFFLASAGLDAAQSIGALPQVARFAQAGAFDLATATDLLTDAQSALGLASDDTAENMENMTRVSDVLVKANTLANATVSQFSEALTEKAGAALRNLNKDMEEGVAVLSVFADQGVKGSAAGTALNSVLEGLTRTARENAGAYDELGVAVFDSEGEMRNMADIVGDLEGAFAGMSTEQRDAALAQLGLTRTARDGIVQLLGSSDAIREYEKELRNAGGTTDEVAGKQLESMKAQFELIKARIDDVALTLGSVLAPVLLDLTLLLADRVIPAVAELGRETIERLTPAFQEVQRQAERLGEYFRRTWAPIIQEVIDGFGDDGLRGAIAAIGENLPDISDAIGELGGRLAGAVRDADWEGLASAVQTKLSESLSFTLDVGGRAATLGQGLVDDLATALEDADWSEIGSTLKTRISGAWSTTSDAGDEGVAIGQSLVDQLSGSLDDADWSGLSTALQGHLSTAMTVTDESGSAAGQAIVDWFAGSLDAVDDWSVIGAALRRGIMGGLSVASPVLGAGVLLADLLAGEIVDGEGDWGAVASNIWSKIQDGLGEAVDFGGWLVGTIAAQVEEQDWSGPADAIGSMLTSALETAEGLGANLAGVLRERLGVGIVEMDWSAPATTLATNFAANFDTAIQEAGLGESLRDALILDEEDFGLLATTINEFLVPAFGDLFFEVGRAGDVIATEFMPTLRNLQDALAPLTPTIETLIGIIGVLVSGAMGVWAEFMSATLVPAIQLTIDIINVMISVLDILVMTWTGAVQAIKALIEGDWTTAWNIAKTVFKNNYDEIVEIWERLPEVMTIPVEVAIAAVAVILDSDVTIATAAEALLGTIKGVFEGIQAVFVEIGKQVLTGLWTGLTDPELLSSILNASLSIYSTVMEGLADLPGLSPSPLGMRIGRQFGEGLVVGMLNMNTDVHQSAGKLGKVVPDGTSEGMAIGAKANANATPTESGHKLGKDWAEGVAGGIEAGAPAGKNASKKMGEDIAGEVVSGAPAGKNPSQGSGQVSDEAASIGPDGEGSGSGATSGGSGGVVPFLSGGAATAFAGKIFYVNPTLNQINSLAGTSTKDSFIDWLSRALSYGAVKVHVGWGGWSGPIHLSSGVYDIVFLIGLLEQGIGHKISEESGSSASSSGFGAGAQGAATTPSGGMTVINNITAKSTDPQEIANEVDAVMKFAALNPRLAR